MGTGRRKVRPGDSAWQTWRNGAIALLSCSAFAVGILIGGAWEPFGQVARLEDWLIGVAAILAFVVICGLWNAILSRALSWPLGLLIGETGAEAVKLLGYAAVAWLGVMLFAAVTWAWFENAAV